MNETHVLEQRGELPEAHIFVGTYGQVVGLALSDAAHASFLRTLPVTRLVEHDGKGARDAGRLVRADGAHR